MNGRDYLKYLQRKNWNDRFLLLRWGCFSEKGERLIPWRSAKCAMEWGTLAGGYGEMERDGARFAEPFEGGRL